MKVTLLQLKEFLIEVFDLELSLDEITDEMAIVDEGLELDSVDTLEILVEVDKKFGIKIPTDQIAKDAFSSVGNLLELINKF